MVDMKWKDFQQLAGLDEAVMDLRLAAHFAICLANESMALQKPEKRVSFVL